jgi:hypothetical protein
MVSIFFTTIKAIVSTTSGLRVASIPMPCATSASFSAFFVPRRSEALLAFVFGFALGVVLGALQLLLEQEKRMTGKKNVVE